MNYPFFINNKLIVDLYQCHVFFFSPVITSLVVLILYYLIKINTKIIYLFC